MTAKIENTKEALIKYLFARVLVNDKTLCWEWQRQLNPAGYGALRATGRPWLAHRLSYSIFSGDPSGLVICHKCDNPKCCNPTHLFAGTQQDNVADMMRKGRQALGLRVGGAKLSDQDKSLIVARALFGESHASIAEDFGVSVSRVGCVARAAGIFRHKKLAAANAKLLAIKEEQP